MKFNLSKSHTTDVHTSAEVRRNTFAASTESPFQAVSESVIPTFENCTWGQPMSDRRSHVVTNHNASSPAIPVVSKKRRRWTWGFAGILTLFSFWTSPGDVRAQEPEAVFNSTGETTEFENVSGSATFTRMNFPQIHVPSFNYPTYPDEPPVVGGTGMKGRIGHIAGARVGRKQSITNFDFSPYVFHENLYLFGEGRFALGNNGKTGGSLGAGGRYFFPRINAIFGGSGWLDIDATRGSTFRQYGISGEFLSEFLDIRGNFYAPYGTQTQVIGQAFEPGSQQFNDRSDFDPALTTGTYLSYQRRIFTASAMRGFDTLFTIPMPGRAAQSVNLEASAGFYGYERQDGSIPYTYGYRIRFDLDILERLSHLFLEINDDKLFKTNVAFGIDINYWNKLGHRPRIGHSQYNRLAEWVRRNRTVVALESSALAPRELAINPTTNNPYVIYQVNSANAGGTDGTLGNPFGSLQDAIDATDPANSSDYIDFVQGNSSFSSPISIDYDGLQVIGEQAIPDVGISVKDLGTSVVLPTNTPQPFTPPQLSGITGNAVTLNAANTRFAAMNILNTTGGDAIFAGSTANGGTIESVEITTVNGGNGINLNSTTGNYEMNNVLISDIEGTAFRVNGGNPVVQFTGISSIDNTTNSHATHGYAVDIEQTDAGSSVNMSNLTIQDTGGSGIRVSGVNPGESNARVTFGPTTLTDTRVVPGTGAVYILNHSGTVSFTGDLTIDGIDSTLTGDSLVIDSLQEGGSVLSSNTATTTISNRRGRGIYVANIADTATGVTVPSINFLGPVAVTGLGAGYTGDDPGVLFQSYSGSLIFTDSLLVDQSRGDGVEVTAGTIAQGTATGTFTAADVTINNVTGAGGVNGTSFNVHDIDKSLFRVNVAGLTVNNRGSNGSAGPIGAGIRIFNNAANMSFLSGTTTVNNQSQSLANAIDIEQNTGSVVFGATAVNSQLGASSYGVRVFQNTDTVTGISFGSLDVTSSGAVGVSMQDNGKVAIGGGTITATGNRAIEVFTSAGITPIQQHNIALTEVNSTGADYGIFVDNSYGQFTVTGANGLALSGGTISNASIAGAFFRDTQRANLNLMRINGGLQGVHAERMLQIRNGIVPGLFMSGMSITGTASEGIFAQSVSNFLLQDSSITGNGVNNTQEQIELLASIDEFDVDNNGTLDSVVYNYTINNNNIVDSLTSTIGGTDMIFIHTDPNIANPVALNLSFINNGAPLSTTNINTVTSNRVSGNAALDINWQGPVNATIDTNQFNLLNATGQIGVNLTIDGVSTVNYTNNGMNAAGASDIGVQALFTQASTLNISDNVVLDDDGFPISGSGFVFSGNNSTGLNLSFLAPGNNITVNNNLFEFTGSGSTGILFQRLAGNAGDTSVAVGGNEIYRPLVVNTGNNNNNTIATGISFQVIQGTITLVNTGNNFVQGGTFLPLYRDYFFANPAAAAGTTILVNGNLIP